MPDSANVLSILSALSASPPAPAGVPTNVLQSVAAPMDAPAPAPMPVQAPPPVQAAPPPAAPVEAPHKRRSLLETIGRISDVIAKVGGAEALYQPTLDARQDRELALGDHARKVSADDIALATSKFELGDKNNTRLGQAARGLQAIRTAGGDVNKAWPVLAQRMGFDAETTAQLGQQLAADPTALDGLAAAMTDPKDARSHYSGNVVYAKGPDGKIAAFQASTADDPARNILPEGYEPIDPQKFVDLGGSVAGVGERSGKTLKILPKTAKPDTVLTTTTSTNNNIRDNRTKITVAGMPARTNISPNGNGKGGGKADPNVPTLLSNIEQGFRDLHGMNALPGEGSAVNQVASAIGRTGIGQHVGEQFGTAPAQKRVEIMKNVSALQQAMLKSLPASATRTKFEQEMLARGLPDPSKMTLQTAQTVIGQLRKSYAEAVAELNAKPAGRTPVVTPRAPARRSSGGWSVVKVQ